MRHVLVCLSIALLPGVGFAQTATTAKTPAFDVVSIREYKNDLANVRRESISMANGYHGRGISPFLLLVTAFVPASGNAGLYNPDQIEGMPDWMRRTEYDIEAKVTDEDVAAWQRPEIQRSMLRQLLTDRFKLVTHTELREKPVYDLVVAKGGPKFKPSTITDLKVIQQTHPTANAMPGGAVMSHGSKQGETMLFGTTIADFATLFGNGVGRPIEDKTGLKGRYDITLTLDLSPGPDGTRPDPAAVVVTALQEQLGLKLEPVKANVEVLVIDQAERPSEN